MENESASDIMCVHKSHKLEIISGRTNTNTSEAQPARDCNGKRMHHSRAEKFKTLLNIAKNYPGSQCATPD